MWSSATRFAPWRLRELRRSAAVAFRCGNRHVGQLDVLTSAAQHQTAAAHISTSNKLRWKKQTLAENSQQRFHVFRSRDASEKNDFAVRSGSFGERASVAVERIAEAWVAVIDGDCRKFPKVA